jgi:hypothetical protein
MHFLHSRSFSLVSVPRCGYNYLDTTSRYFSGNAWFFGEDGGGHLCDEATAPICAGASGSGIVVIRYTNPNPTTTIAPTTP